METLTALAVLCKYGGLSWWGRQWARILWATIAYGYRPTQALVFIAFFVALGFVTFGSAYRAGEIVPSDKAAYEQLKDRALPPYYESFCAVTYSFDTFVPIIDLGQRSKWTPGSAAAIGANLRVCGDNTLNCIVCEAGNIPLLGTPALWFVRLYRWFDIIAGWFFTSLFVVGISGLVRKD